jgi:hypothetical protein
LKIKLKGLHFDTIEVIEAESQNKASRMHLKNGRNTGSSSYIQKGTTLRVMVALRPKVNF